jgi:nitrite reductase (cytochrome c-552)
MIMKMKNCSSDQRRQHGGQLIKFGAVIVFTSLLTIGGLALLISIMEHKEEAKKPFFRVVELTDDTEDPVIWGKNFPLQYDGYKRTSEMVRTKYGGSDSIPHTPATNDPRTVVTQSKIEEDPRLKKMWAGYAFAIDFREERGHAYMLDDQTFTGRQKKPQPGTCLNCHASMYLAYKKAGNGDIVKGFEEINHLPYAEARKLVSHPVACIDCHDSQTMALRVTRPAFMEGMKAYKASQGIADYDVNRDATRQEMRSFVCGQCHDEYYFKGKEKRLVFPWHKGLKADEILAYYDSEGVKQVDWVQADTGAPMLKAQHPEFETWNQGIHARSGVACADCHMPYERVGAQKISNHHVRSPLLNINKACQTCHKWSEADMKARVEIIQDRHKQMRDTTINALMDLIDDIVAAKAAGASTNELATAQDCQRKAQFLFDFVEAENSMGFHAPQEAARVLNLSLDWSRKGQNSLRSLKTPPKS